MSDWPIHGRISGPVVMIGFGSIGRGTLPLLERHFEFDKSRLSVIDPDPLNKWILDERGIPLIQQHVTKENYVELLTPLLTKGEGQGFCVNLSVDTSSVAIMELCRSLGVLYIDTVNEPWLGFYFDKNRGPAERSRRHDRGVHLRRQSRHGVVPREAGNAESRARPQPQRPGAEDARRMGVADAPRRREGHPYR